MPDDLTTLSVDDTTPSAPDARRHILEKRTLDAWSRFRNSAALEPVETLIERRAAAQSAHSPAHVLRKIDAMVGASKRLSRRAAKTRLTEAERQGPS